jgi:hypothetical protein
MHSRSEGQAWRTVSAAVTSWSLMACLPAAVVGAEAAATRPAAAAARSRTIVDHAVVPAGGMHCRHCGVGACRVHGGHLAGCRNGMCEPHCPVRPSQYGFYHTQWRRWPGQGVVPTSAEAAATPVAPPASQVPSVDEESPAAGDQTRAAGDEPVGSEPDATPAPPAQEEALAPEPVPQQPPRAAPAAEPTGAEPPVPPTPPGEAPVTPGKDATEGDLFDQSAVPIPEAEIPLESGAMRYPAPVGRSLAAGIPPWRLLPQRGQRAAVSDRGR